MTEPTPATVAVPVELLFEVLALKMTIPLDQKIRALLPRPKPRLVAVPGEVDDWPTDVPYQAWLATQPDLLTLLDEAINYAWDVSSRSTPEGIKARIRTALGVTE